MSSFLLLYNELVPFSVRSKGEHPKFSICADISYAYVLSSFRGFIQNPVWARFGLWAWKSVSPLLLVSPHPVVVV